MAELVKVKEDLGEVEGAPALQVTHTEGQYADAAEVDRYAGPGVDAVPLPGDIAVVVETTNDTGDCAAVAYSCTDNRAGPGEHRVFSRNSTGASVAHVWARADGSLELVANLDGDAASIELGGGTVKLSNGALNVELGGGTVKLSNGPGSIEITPTGEVKINGATVSLAGDVTTAGGASLQFHTHTSAAPGAPTSPPIPTGP